MKSTVIVASLLMLLGGCVVAPAPVRVAPPPRVAYVPPAYAIPGPGTFGRITRNTAGDGIIQPTGGIRGGVDAWLVPKFRLSLLYTNVGVPSFRPGCRNPVTGM